MQSKCIDRITVDFPPAVEMAHLYGGSVEKKGILLVEDDNVVRAMIKEGLERQYHVLEAVTGSKAMEQRLDRYAIGT